MQHLYVYKGKAWNDVKLSVFEIVLVLPYHVGKGVTQFARKKNVQIAYIGNSDIQPVTSHCFVSPMKFEVFIWSYYNNELMNPDGGGNRTTGRHIPKTAMLRTFLVYLLKGICGRLARICSFAGRATQPCSYCN
jgi:hypothetical protein